jgi:4-azaleucine resistance transporter AzlC
MPASSAPKAQAATTARRDFFDGVRSTAPFLASAIPMGVVGGVLGVASGLSAWSTLALAMAVNSGAAQFVGFALIKDGAAAPTILLTTLILALRMLIYSTIVTPHLREVPHRWRVLVGFGLIDEVFFVAHQRLKNGTMPPRRHLYFIGASACLYVSWMTATVVGALLGAAVPDLAGMGLDFPITAMFIAMLVADLRSWRVATVIVAAGVTAMLARGLPNNLGIILAAVVGALAGAACEHVLRRIARRRHPAGTSEEANR